MTKTLLDQVTTLESQMQDVSANLAQIKQNQDHPAAANVDLSGVTSTLSDLKTQVGGIAAQFQPGTADTAGATGTQTNS